jgi:hypothetical protein
MKRSRPILSFLAALLWLAARPAMQAHEARPACLEITETAVGRYDVLWRTPVLSGARLPVGLRFPEKCRNVVEPAQQELNDSMIERRVIDAGPGTLSGQLIEFPGLQATITDVLVRATLRNGTHWSVIVRPAQASLTFTGSKGTLEIAQTYLWHGVQHILFGIDHLLFVFGLLLIVKSRWMLFKTITAFTVAHSLTLAVATFGYVNVPAVPLNAAIALSIFFLAPEIIRQWRGETSLTIRHPWAVAFVFGLLHGVGFACALTGAGLPHADLPLALLSFNVGVEAGQMAFVLLVILLERSFHQLEFRWPRFVEVIPGYLVGSLGAFWTIERTAILLGGLR